MSTLIPMSPKEVKKVESSATSAPGRLTQREAAALLGVTDRAVRLWLRAYELLCEADDEVPLARPSVDDGDPCAVRRKDRVHLHDKPWKG